MSETKYGVISDIHRNVQGVPKAIEVLKNKGANKIILNGDIANMQRSLQDSQNYVAHVLMAAGESGLETIIQPGSHETFASFSPVMNHFSEKYSNLIDATKNPKIEQNGHDLIFLPGSDFSCRGEYQIGNGQISTGTYLSAKEGLIPMDFNTYMDIMSNGKMWDLEITQVKGFVSYHNMNDLKKLVTNPEKTIVVSHISRKFDNIEVGVDVAEFGIAEDSFNQWFVEYENKNRGNFFTYNKFQGELQEIFKKKKVKKILDESHTIYDGSFYPKTIAEEILNKNPKLPITIREENRGNVDLAKVYDDVGLTKEGIALPTGHFHESGHRAHDMAGKQVKEGELVKGLCWNSGFFEEGQTGILTIKDSKASYQNITI